MRLRPRAADRYAKAIHDLAVAAGAVEVVGRDFALMRRWTLESPDFDAFLSNYLLPGTARMGVLEKVMASQLHPLTWQFIRFVESQRRLALLPHICICYEEQERVRQGILRARLDSALPLEPAEQQLIANRAGIKTGKRIQLQVSIVPALLGGYRLQIEDTVYDYSLSARLRMLRARMLAGPK